MLKFNKEDYIMRKTFIIVMCILVTSIICCACSPQNKNVFVQYKSNGDGGYISGTAIQIIKYGENSSVVEAIPNEGYQFTKWSDERTDNPRNDSNIKRDLEIVAIFKKIPITLQYSTSSNYGKLEGAPIQNLEYGDNSSAVKAIPYEGFTFVKWSDDRTDNPRIDTDIKQNINVQAIFEKVVLNVKYTAQKNGQIKGADIQLIEYGDNSFTVEAIPNYGYRFIEWSDGRTDNPRKDTNVKQDIDVEAIFREKEIFDVNYSAGENGNIEGVAKQNIYYGDNTTAVEAIPDEGYRFAKWSDGCTDNPRIDTDVKQNIDVQAIFEEIINTYELIYNYATENTEQKEITIGYFDDLSKITLPVPQRLNSTFEGWYFEIDYQTQVADKDGKITMSKDNLRNNSKKLYAKYTTLQEAKYKILMVYVTEIDDEFYLFEKKPGEWGEICGTKYVKYSMSEDERLLCKMTTQYFEEMLNTMFAGLVTFEVDEYYTTQPLKESSFRQGISANSVDYFIDADDIPEMSDEMLSKYGSVITTVNFMEYEDIRPRLHSSTGLGGSKYACVYMDSQLRGFYINNQSLQDTLLNPSHIYYKNCWLSYLETYLHEFTHTVESRFYSVVLDEKLTYHYVSSKLSKYYAEIYPDFWDNHYFYLIRISVLYLLGQAEYNGKTYGIPYDFWLGKLTGKE